MTAKSIPDEVPTPNFPSPSWLVAPVNTSWVQNPTQGYKGMGLRECKLSAPFLRVIFALLLKCKSSNQHQCNCKIPPGYFHSFLAQGWMLLMEGAEDEWESWKPKCVSKSCPFLLQTHTYIYGYGRAQEEAARFSSTEAAASQALTSADGRGAEDNHSPLGAGKTGCSAERCTDLWLMTWLHFQKDCQDEMGSLLYLFCWIGRWKPFRLCHFCDEKEANWEEKEWISIYLSGGILAEPH